MYFISALTIAAGYAILCKSCISLTPVVSQLRLGARLTRIHWKRCLISNNTAFATQAFRS
jgi:hypothetical protein